MSGPLPRNGSLTPSDRSGTFSDRRGFSYDNEKVQRPRPPLLDSFESHIDLGIADSFALFSKRVYDLDKQLGSFSTEARRLGRSYGILLAARELREQLARILLIFHKNAVKLYPPLRESSYTINMPMKPTQVGAGKRVDVDQLPGQLEVVAAVFKEFRECLHEFREYTDESIKIKALMASFEKDLKYHASCLKAYTADLHSASVQRYIHQITEEVGDDMDNLTSAFSFFIEIGMPAIRHEQRRYIESFLNMSTIAIFFSAVTATTLQMSTNLEPSQITSIVNTFWFCALVFSIGAALNSLLAMAWKQATYGSRGRRLPLGVTIFIHGSPPVFLAISIACFSAGLVLFSYASGQTHYTSAITLAATAVTSFGLAAISCWIAYEHVPLLLIRGPGSRTLLHNSDLEDLTLKHGFPSLAVRRPRNDSFSEHSMAESASDNDNRGPILTFLDRFAPESMPVKDSDIEEQKNPESDVPNERSVQAQARWKESVKAISRLQAGASAFQPRPSRPEKMRASSTFPKLSPTLPSVDTQGQASPFGFGGNHAPQQVIDLEQQSMLCHLEYSPNGRWLATTSSNDDRKNSKTVVYNAEGEYFSHSSFQHSTFCEQLAWSPDNLKILVRLASHIDLCYLESEKTMPIHRHHVDSVAWCVDGRGFFSVERSHVLKISLAGQILAKFDFPNLQLRGVAPVPHTDLLLVIGRLASSPDKLQPSNSRPEKQLIVYDMKANDYKHRTPLLEDLRHVTLARNGLDVLISYKNKPPQLWTLEPKLRTFVPQMKRRIMYTVQPSVELAGPGCFAGDRDQLLLCTSITGDVHIWDRDSGTPVHHIPANIPPNAVGDSFHCIAGNPLRTTNAYTFATGAFGELKIWTYSQTPNGSSRVLRPSSPPTLHSDMPSKFSDLRHVVEEPHEHLDGFEPVE